MSKKFTVETFEERNRVTCVHDNLIRDFDDTTHRTTDRKPECGCYEVEICAGCKKEDCGGCPCGTSMTVREIRK